MTNESESLPTMRGQVHRRPAAFQEVSGAVCLLSAKQRAIVRPGAGCLPRIRGANVENGAPAQDFAVAIKETDVEDELWAQGREAFEEKMDILLPEMPILDSVSGCGSRYRSLKERRAKSRMGQSSSIPAVVEVGHVACQRKAALQALRGI
jgi:hypothetical protein